MSGLSRDEFNALWTRLDAEAQVARFSHGAVLRLTDFYRGLDEDDKRVVDAILASWVSGGDARRRFDALALIDEFKIRSALPALEADLAHLSQTVGPSVPTDRAKLERIISRIR